MEIHIQRCQHCRSDHLKNILLRKPGRPDKVYVQCHDCGRFVASYVIAPLGYYHHGKGSESFLRSFQRSGEFMSGRKVRTFYEERKSREVKGFEETVELLRKRDEEKKADE